MADTKTKRLESQTPGFKRWKRFWGILFWVVIVLCMGACQHAISSLPEQADAKEWTTQTLPVPYLHDRTQHVCNPDSVLSQAAVDSINRILVRLEESLGIQSIVITIRHVPNGDTFRFAQDLGNHYGVGAREQNNGLIIVVANDDRRYTLAPGSGLEADLTDIECNRLARQYLVPHMKENNPDAGLYELTLATYNLLSGKELPEVDTSQFRARSSDAPAEDLIAMISTFLFFWFVLYAFLNEKYLWIVLATTGGTGYTGFGRDRSHTGGFWGSGWNGGGSFGSGRGFGGGGSFGGGSFGGGGASGGW